MNGNGLLKAFFACSVTLVLLAPHPARADYTIWFNPADLVERSSHLSVSAFSPSRLPAVELQGDAGIWFDYIAFPLVVPSNAAIKAVTVCYDNSAGNPLFIGWARITRMTTPNAELIVYDSSGFFPNGQVAYRFTVPPIVPDGMIALRFMVGNNSGSALGIINIGAIGVELGDIPTDIPPLAASMEATTDLLRQNHPNPFNPSTLIEYRLPHDALVSVTVYDVQGERVRRLVNGPMTAGDHEVAWDGRNERGDRMASGIYYYELVTAGRREARPMVMLK